MGVLDDGERVWVTDAAAWRAWLTKNHATSTGAWLVRPRAGSDVEVIGYEDAIRQALCFGWIDGPVRSFDERIGGLWFSPRKANSGWAATNKARLKDLEATGEMTDAGRRAVDVARTNGSWELLDGPEAGIEPEELTAALDAVPAARAAWDAFPASTKKFGLSQIALARRPATKSARIAKIVADAAEGKRPQ
ncbi:YdeI family protein [Microbacterium sp. C7(2022)]|uniref:YdeI/OmpD-associated family protein n=1 Tax=Microbacterium sp. C7(2022) TaxID=2992759 RepID=UPI00237C4EEF|nr:YdeI/OmpD-associated family protein [Microbacterium sp. C7(2022)]MDE0546507.1 YdeI/OmpD-associated family protein [Microbacterium sp. C7(2022)]